MTPKDEAALLKRLSLVEWNRPFHFSVLLNNWPRPIRCATPWHAFAQGWTSGPLLSGFQWCPRVYEVARMGEGPERSFLGVTAVVAEITIPGISSDDIGMKTLLSVGNEGINCLVNELRPTVYRVFMPLAEPRLRCPVSARCLSYLWSPIDLQIKMWDELWDPASHIWFSSSRDIAAMTQDVDTTVVQ
ncbi:MAG TPA: hypothetical protein VF814_21800 [Casimicrobiaceae bacterium]